MEDIMQQTPNQNYYSYPNPIIAPAIKEPDSAHTQKLKRQFPYFGIGSMLYAFFYAFCLYKNTAGITYPFFVAGTLFFFFFSMRRLGVPYKKDSLFYVISIVLLGISNCLTTSTQLLAMNKVGIFLLAFILMLHTVYADKEWDLPKYFAALFQTIGTCIRCLTRPLSDRKFYFDAQKQVKTANQEGSEQKNYVIPIIIGLSITIPLLFLITALLASADAVFEEMLDRLSLNFFQDFNTIVQVVLLIVVVFFCTYAVYAALCMKKVKEEVTDKRTLDPVIAIVVTASLSAVYLLFSVIQIMYLFIGDMKLPEGYTYSSYAREGFFQLLAVCIINLLLVLFCLHFFRENTALKVILTVISGCTYIMILSSALRMIMYINYCHLTFLRIFVLWSLAVIFLLMTGITIFIYYGRFPLFRYGLIVVTVFYIGLSFAHPDYWIAKYNLKAYARSYEMVNNHMDYDFWYLTSLSADAAPVLLDPEKNTYLTLCPGLTPEDIFLYLNYRGAKFEVEYWEDYLDIPYWDSPSNDDLRDYCYRLEPLHSYYTRIRIDSANMHLRNFNFSIHAAEKCLLPEEEPFD